MVQVPVDEGRKRLEAKGLRREHVGSFAFDLWLSPENKPEMVAFYDLKTKKFYDGESLNDVLSRY